MLTEIDLRQIELKGIPLQVIEKQLQNFRNGFPFVNLVAPATTGNGIHHFGQREAEGFARHWENHAGNLRTVKFVPASGAASRMFKHLFEFLEKWKKSKHPEDLFSDKGFNSTYHFFERLADFAFYDELNNSLLRAGYQLDECLKSRQYGLIAEFLLDSRGLDYGSLPKGLLKFHRYENFVRTPVGEHMVEGAHYCIDRNRLVSLHLTVSPEHLEKFGKLVAKVRPYYEEMLSVKFNISFSIQKPSTDTIAVNINDEPFREKDGTILFRPGGHGALIENLSEIDADVVFIKNIDNVVPDRLKPETFLHKKVIGGLLLKLQEQIFKYVDLLERQAVPENLLKEIFTFCKNELDIVPDKSYETMSQDQKRSYLFRLLNRPIRVCGMVRNEGEPGGGPFWLKNQKGEISLQIVEASQIDAGNEEQRNILASATHFNPVDLVCGVRNYRGKHFDLHHFVDPSTGFISIKSKDGKQLKAQELPGLWNGAMADWITLFVEVPIATFNPVKVVNDLLREQHQN
jgi:hypothetical protein